jgi:hypothetical protein
VSDALPAEAPDWVPPLIPFSEYDGAWEPFIEDVYAVFRASFVTDQPRFQGRWVRCRRDPIYDKKEAGFWHCTSDGETEDNRIPDIRRCERIGWIRAVIEHSTEAGVDVWENERNGERRSLLWLREEFLIVLAVRTRPRDGFQYFQLITAYCTVEEHRKRKLRKERDEFRRGQENV